MSAKKEELTLGGTGKIAAYTLVAREAKKKVVGKVVMIIFVVKAKEWKGNTIIRNAPIIVANFLRIVLAKNVVLKPSGAIDVIVFASKRMPRGNQSAATLMTLPSPMKTSWSGL